ncbi:MAG TPA: polyribonucleotide nucleotidyltransferase [Deinococcales bacterium]|nr:polyribonucleotide nucleotidyltransferase [Deinococcales bacterium]
MDVRTYSVNVGGRELSIETGKMAQLVSGSCVLRYGDVVILATAQGSDKPSPMDFLPLTVEFEERHYAVGRIPGSFQRRESRPGKKAILAARITDRQIRPLFPKGYRRETQVILTVLSADQVNTPEILGPIAASAALSISDIPWGGPCATVRVGRLNGEFVLNPTIQELERSELDLVVAGTKEAVLMVEAGAKEVSEEVVLGAIQFAHESMQPILDLQLRMREDLGQPKMAWEDGKDAASQAQQESDLAALTERAQAGGLREALLTKSKHDRSVNVKAVRDRIIAELNPLPEGASAEQLAAGAARTEALKAAFEKVEKATLRRLVLDEDLRADGRDTRTVRPITIEAGLLPRAHGSALFTRGETQVLGTVTLGNSRDEQIIDDLSLEDSERFLMHYNFPPYSTGEVKRLGGQSRREIGHGALAERALRAVLPNYDDFPYVIRVVGDVLQSNGSSSMGTVCAGCLALMDAGVPIEKPVAGVAMGLVKEGERYRILTDILGLEDALGDMDFKVCGTADGINALQMDIKISGITGEVLREALAQAREGRLHILGKMTEVLAAPRPELSATAPRILAVKVPTEKIGMIIGPGGKNIRELESLGAKVDIDEDGTIRIFSADSAAAEAVRARILASTEDAKVGQEYDGKVVKTTNFGAFINLFGSTDGMLHISQMAEGRVNAVEDVLKVGDRLRVKVASIDPQGKIDLVRPELEGKIAPRAPRAPRSDGPRRDGPGGGFGDRGPRRDRH